MACDEEQTIHRAMQHPFDDDDDGDDDGLISLAHTRIVEYVGTCSALMAPGVVILERIS